MHRKSPRECVNLLHGWLRQALSLVDRAERDTRVGKAGGQLLSVLMPLLGLRVASAHLLPMGLLLNLDLREPRLSGFDRDLRRLFLPRQEPRLGRGHLIPVGTPEDASGLPIHRLVSAVFGAEDGTVGRWSSFVPELEEGGEREPERESDHERETRDAESPSREAASDAVKRQAHRLRSQALRKVIQCVAPPEAITRVWCPKRGR